MRILLLGNQSTGKTTAARLIQAVFEDVHVVEEYPRRFYEGLGYCCRSPVPEAHFQTFYRVQKQLESEHHEQRLVVFDTDAFFNLNAWRLLEGRDIHGEPSRFDLTLFFQPDIPFVDDGGRVLESDAQRVRNNLHYEHMAHLAPNVHVISGAFEDRNAKVLAAVTATLGVPV